MVLVPELDLAIVHRVDTDRGASMSDDRVAGLIESIFAARTPASESAWSLRNEDRPVALVPLRPAPLGPPGSGPAAYVQPLPVPESVQGQVVGTYTGANGAAVQLFTRDGRLFAHRDVPIPSEVELFAAEDGSLFSPEAPVRLTPGTPEERTRDTSAGKWSALVLTVAGRRLDLVRAGS